MNDPRRFTLRAFADGGVVQPPQQSAWERLWGVLMGKEALKRAAGENSPPPPPHNQDLSIVKKAAEEAGKRMEEEKRQPTKKLACGGVISRYGNYGR